MALSPDDAAFSSLTCCPSLERTLALLSSKIFVEVVLETIEISPLAFMRGRTFKKAWIVADEMQNATPSQMKMLLTRLGEGSKIVVTGDVKQADRSDVKNGLLNLSSLIGGHLFDEKKLNFIRSCQFSNKDIERHPAVTEVLELYGEK